MSRRPASSLWAPLIAGLAALALAGCGGGSEPPGPPPVAASTPAPQPEPQPAEARPSEPAPAPAPAPTPVSEPRSERTAAVPSDSEATASTPDRNAKAQVEADAALKWLQDQEAARVDYERRVAEASAKVTEANAQVAEWERNALAVKNPYLARPKLSEEDAAAVAGKGGAERAQMAEDRLEELRKARDAAQKDLDTLRANPPN